MKVHAEIEYKKDGILIHSDVCPPSCNFEKIDDEYKIIIHEALNEWIEKSNGTGGFYIKNEKHLFRGIG